MYAANSDGTTIPAFELTDSEGLQRYGLGMIRPGGGGIGNHRLRPFLKDGYLTEARSLEDLAVALGIDPSGLGETVARMNRFAETGEDTDFQRGSNAYQRANGDPGHTPNPTLGPILKPPFYAIRLWPGDIGAAISLERFDR